MSVVQPSDGSSRNRDRIRLGISACLLGERVRFSTAATNGLRVFRRTMACVTGSRCCRMSSKAMAKDGVEHAQAVRRSGAAAKDDPTSQPPINS